MCEYSHLSSSYSTLLSFCFVFFFNDTATTEIYTLSLHDALPIYEEHAARAAASTSAALAGPTCHKRRSEEHTSELQSRRDLVCRLLLEKKKKTNRQSTCTRRITALALRCSPPPHAASG